MLHISRSVIFNLRPISGPDTLQQRDKFESTQRILLLREIAIAFQTNSNVQKSKWTGGTDECCEYCKKAKDANFIVALNALVVTMEGKSIKPLWTNS